VLAGRIVYGDGSRPFNLLIEIYMYTRWRVLPRGTHASQTVRYSSSSRKGPRCGFAGYPRVLTIWREYTTTRGNLSRPPPSITATWSRCARTPVPSRTVYDATENQLDGRARSTLFIESINTDGARCIIAWRVTTGTTDRAR